MNTFIFLVRGIMGGLGLACLVVGIMEMALCGIADKPYLVLYVGIACFLVGSILFSAFLQIWENPLYVLVIPVFLVVWAPILLLSNSTEAAAGGAIIAGIFAGVCGRMISNRYESSNKTPEDGHE